MGTLETPMAEASSPLGKELLLELAAADWEVTFSRSIAPMGVALGSSRGVQRPRNEDRVAVAQVISAARDHYSVAIVCDGVGGSRMGDVAATIALATCLAELSLLNSSPPIAKLLVSLFRKMDEAIRVALKGRGATTASVVLATPNGLVVAANVGDSRIYSWRPDSHFLKQVSVDDTIENELKHLVAKDSAFLDARGLRGSLSQALGEMGRTSDELRVTVLGKDHFQTGGLLIATDGAWKADELGFGLVVKNCSTGIDAVRRVLSTASWTGGIDNVSVVAIDDLPKFARRREAPQPVKHKGLTAWIGDTRLVLLQGEQDAQSPNLRRPTKQTTSTERKKNPGRRKVRVKPNMAAQLRLEEQSSASSASMTESRKRPKVEISTDEDSKK